MNEGGVYNHTVFTRGLRLRGLRGFFFFVEGSLPTLFFLTFSLYCFLAARTCFFNLAVSALLLGRRLLSASSFSSFRDTPAFFGSAGAEEILVARWDLLTYQSPCRGYTSWLANGYDVQRVHLMGSNVHIPRISVNLYFLHCLQGT